MRKSLEKGEKASMINRRRGMRKEGKGREGERGREGIMYRKEREKGISDK
jgi:hypothetical protein